ncbi:F-box/LRR-repeat protein 12-like [Rutidosis leptorrhynchoides]|uniref:F-box/LRR-repeat protein 12-like n=1 Tax=Rutidosis leptorrhynchoides TaxID=125765 RepID=UPI003A996797
MDVSDDGKHMLCLITQLPDDLWCLIYQKLDELCDQRSFSLTGHRFHDIAISSCKCVFEVTTLDKLRRSYIPLDSILRGRYICFMHFESPSSLSVLDLSFCAITDNGLETVTKYYNKSLIHVDLRHCPRITNTGIWFLKQNCPRLRVLKISGCNQVVGVASQQGFSETLTFLQADAHVLSPTGLLSGGGVEYLIVSNLNILCSKNEQRGLAAIGSGMGKNLKILSFYDGSFVTDECIMRISKGCPLLQELKLSRCSGIGFPGWV